YPPLPSNPRTGAVSWPRRSIRVEAGMMRMTSGKLKVGLLGAVALGLGAIAPAAVGAPKDVGIASGPAVTRRLSPEQYQNIIADVFGSTIELGGRFEPEMRANGLLAVGDGQ